ncbi:MAG UNVERIFIED_CONTAM: hypothetical protein LVR18_03150 [Planctomycetaceae bacterium]
MHPIPIHPDSFAVQPAEYVINGVNSVTIAGRVLAAGSLHVNTGVSTTWSQDLLESGVINPAELSSGTLDILASGSLQASDSVQLKTGGNFTVRSATDLSSGPLLALRRSSQRHLRQSTPSPDTTRLTLA